MFQAVPANLSAQEIVDCAFVPVNRPLSTIDVFGYIRKIGVATERSYPSSTLRRRRCHRDGRHERLIISHFYLVKPGDERALMITVAQFGPLSVSIKVTKNFFFYQGGVFFDPACNDGQRTTNHAVLLVGYGTDPTAGDFWIVQICWGTQWGEQGYARMIRNSQMDCEITSAAIYPIL